MKIKYVKFHNMFRFGEEDNEIDFDEVFGQSQGGIALISGSTDGDENVSNGAGKSSIIEGIYWILYEKMPRLIRNSNRTGSAHTEVVKTNPDGSFACNEAYGELRLETADGAEWRIRRGRKITKSGRHSPILEVEKNGESESALTQADPEETIRNLIGIDHQSFLNSVLFAQKDSGKFLSGTDMNRKDILMNLLSLQVIDKMLALLRDPMKKESKAVMGSLEAKIEVLKQRLSDASEGELRKKKMELAAEIAEGKRHVQEIEKEIEGLASASEREVLQKARDHVGAIKAEEEEAAKTKEGAVKELKAAAKRLSSAAAGAGERLRKIGDAKSKLEARYKKALAVTGEFTKESMQARREAVNAARKEKEKLDDERAKVNENLRKFAADIARYEENIRIGNAEVEEWKSQLGKAGKSPKCPTCGSDWDVDKIKSRIDGKEREIAALAEKRAELEAKESEDREKSVELDGRIRKAEAAIADETALASDVERLKAAKEAVRDCKERASALKEDEREAETAVGKAKLEAEEAEKRLAQESSRHDRRLEKIAEAMSKASAKLGKAEDAVKEIDSKIADMRRKISKLSEDEAKRSGEIGAIDEKLASRKRDADDVAALEEDLQSERKTMERISYFESLLSGDVKNEVADACVPLLNYYANDFLSVLNPSISLLLESVGKSVPLGVRGDTASSYEMLSGGEQEAIRLCVDMALSMISIGGSTDLPDMIFLDEIFGSLDGRTEENVFELLERLRGNFSRILVITHDPVLKERFNTVIGVDKRRGTSRISYKNRNV